MTGPSRPLVKQWQTRRDTLVRDAHDDVDGQLRLIDEPFTVAGVSMSAPGDPTAPPELVINCRCVLRLERAPKRSAAGPPVPAWLADAPPGTADRIAAFSAWPTESKPAARAASEIPREITASAGRITDDLTAALAPALAAASAGTGRRYRFEWDTTPIPFLADPDRNAFPYGAEVSHPEVTAAAVEHTGGMIALIPTEEDAERLALDDGEEAGELHCTAFYLGEDASQWNEDQRNELINGVRARAASLDGPVRARLFGVNHWNPGGDDPVWVWAVSDDGDDGPGLQEARYLVQDALEDTHERPEIPRQHSPWVAHVTGVYTAETWPLDAMADRLGEITFDRVRVAFAGEYTDIPLGPEEEPPMDEQTAATVTAALPTRAWSTPGDTALAFENQQTGDGRIFAAGALSWDGSGPWPLQYADEMLMGHEGAELAGAIYGLGRDGDRIPGNGVLYLSQRAGAEAAMLLEQEAPSASRSTSMTSTSSSSPATSTRTSPASSSRASRPRACCASPTGHGASPRPTRPASPPPRRPMTAPRSPGPGAPRRSSPARAAPSPRTPSGSWPRRAPSPRRPGTPTTPRTASSSTPNAPGTSWSASPAPGSVARPS